jgi:hypothetical protein
MSGKNRWAAAAVFVALLGMSGLTERAVAQITANASINATANVSGVAPLTASGYQDLTFGAVTAGTPKSANTGRFSISGAIGTPVTVSFSLPSVLTASSSSGTIPILFGATDGLNCGTASASCPAPTSFDPNAPLFTSLGATGALYIGIGGTVTPPTLTSTDVYSGVITLTVSY